MNKKEVVKIIEFNGLDLELFKKRSDARTPSGLVLSYAQRFRKEGNFEYAFVFQELYRQVFNLEKSEEYKALQWKKKSGVEFIVEPHRVIAIRYQRSEPDEKPKETRRELTRDEINHVIYWIGKLQKEEGIKTSELAEKVYNLPWKQVFSNRHKHKHLVEILNYLDYKEKIKYSRKGKIKVVGKIEHQENLQWEM